MGERVVKMTDDQEMMYVFLGGEQWVLDQLDKRIRTVKEDRLAKIDLVGQWLKERTEEAGGMGVERPVAYADFRAWCERGRLPRSSPQGWWSDMEDKGFQVHRTARSRHVVGLGLKATPEGMV